METSTEKARIEKIETRAYIVLSIGQLKRMIANIEKEQTGNFVLDDICFGVFEVELNKIGNKEIQCQIWN